jgi:hypothetical protein
VRRTNRRALLVLAAGAALGACGSSPYYAEQERWTRSVDAYESFEAKALVAATLKVEPFRRAYVEEYARLFQLAPEQKVALLESELEEDRRTLTLVVAFYTQDPSWNDLNPARGIWEVRIENGRGDNTPPFSVSRLNKRNPTWRTLYPFFRQHHMLYELRFERMLPDGRPIARGGEPLELVIAGAPTRMRMRWHMP